MLGGDRHSVGVDGTAIRAYTSLPALFLALGLGQAIPASAAIFCRSRAPRSGLARSLRCVRPPRCLNFGAWAQAVRCAPRLLHNTRTPTTRPTLLASRRSSASQVASWRAPSRFTFHPGLCAPCLPCRMCCAKRPRARKNASVTRGRGGTLRRAAEAGASATDASTAWIISEIVCIILIYYQFEPVTVDPDATIQRKYPLPIAFFQFLTSTPRLGMNFELPYAHNLGRRHPLNQQLLGVKHEG